MKITVARVAALGWLRTIKGVALAEWEESGTPRSCVVLDRNLCI